MRLHHIGKVVSNLEEAVEYYKSTFGFSKLDEPVIDPIQKVEVCFVEMGLGRDLTIELIKPVSEDSPVSKFLSQGGGLHHLCFEVDDIHEAIKTLRAKGSLIFGEPVPGKGHKDQLTVWLYTSEKELVELVEKEKK
ncbi:MAG: Lactoylglutathione lyase [Candidatus Saganbacteria bacterium]|uniref:Lactoylglutathione lyase n=1 Tax=Candidatus Saganbacteria bacterium TaxID=2575572 RepID=A0A833P0K1_UNCSA|nr:MAG: Lactoylglutathione lyase [Candidatus Saganbacteria bacterium]